MCMVNCVSIFFVWDTFKLFIFSVVKCVLTFGMLVAYQVCSVDVMSVLWNWLYRRLGPVLSGVVFQISGYK
jgi:drug/metabolite transporter (DMT)-like permease